MKSIEICWVLVAIAFLFVAVNQCSMPSPYTPTLKSNLPFSYWPKVLHDKNGIEYVATIEDDELKLTWNRNKGPSYLSDVGPVLYDSSNNQYVLSTVGCSKVSLFLINPQDKK